MATTKRILITGGSGFIGSHFVDHIFKNTDWEVVCLERLNLSGNLNRIAELDSYKELEKNKKTNRFKYVWHDLKSTVNQGVAKAIGDVNYIVHFAASTHVDRAIEDPMPFVMDNVVGSVNLMQYARTLKNLELFLNFSTDEVYGPAPKGVFHKEGAPFNPTNMYSATKAAQELAAMAFFKTYGLPIVNTHTMNNFGERQHPEKFVPKTISKIMKGEPMPIYGTMENGVLTAISSRVWMYAENTADATFFLLKNAKPGEEYNVIGTDEYDILALAKMIAEIMGKPLIPEYVGFYGTRPGHDLRYALDGSKLKAMGWASPNNFKESLEKTVRFTMENEQWRA